MVDRYFEIGPRMNIVAIQDAPGLLELLKLSTQYPLTHKQHQHALAIIEQVQANSQTTLLDVFNAFQCASSLKLFALAIQKVCLPS